MAYQVIARKWRPQTFEQVVGQRHVMQTLENAIRQNRLAHAYIFSGTRGVGKTTTARILAKCLNCVKGPTATPCNECEACVAITAGTSLDVLEIDAASNRGIDQIRELREMVRYAPAGGRYKVVILDEAHQLTDEASNALLKTLEEPPEKVVFILATTQPEDLADTIKSRAQLFQFRSLSFQEIADAIERIAKEEKLEIEPGAVAVLARAAEGSLRDGLSLLEQAIAYCGDEITDAQVRELLGVVAEEILDDLIAAVENQSAEQALSLVQRLHAGGHNLQHFCRESIRHLRNLLVAKVAGADSPLITEALEQRPRLAKQAENFSEEDLTRFFQILMSTDEDLRRKPDPRLHLELGLLRLVNAARLAPLEQVLSDLRAEKLPASAGRATAPVSRSASTASRESGTSENKMHAAAAGIGSAPGTGASMNASASAAAPPPANFSSPEIAEKLSPTPAPVPASPPRVVAKIAESHFSGLAGAQMEAIQSLLRNQQKFLWSMVEHATRWELNGAEMNLYFPAESRSLTDILQGRETMEKLRTILSSVMGQPLRVCVKLDSSRNAPLRLSDLRARVEEDPIVRAMLERFGGKISEVKQRSED
ncbi:MAG TPA: DNA polymerase III subunit gamma/tau [Candidatus Acidoferrales bacterium]|nr:DNA polymerase III subunit gamma/tau [Candidatus Acidoferrales bacterium]